MGEGMTDQLISLIDSELSKPKLQRKSMHLFKLFEQDREVDRRLDARQAMWMTLAVYLGFGGLDFVLIPDVCGFGRSLRAWLSASWLWQLSRRFARWPSKPRLSISSAPASW